jgi:electron transfer flavoprotein beta subunit
MKIGVLVKQIPGSEASLRVRPDGQWVEEEALEYEMNESDAYALEEALLIKEQSADGGEVVVASMGPPERTPKVIREALAKGADRGIHIVEEPPYETDPFLIAETFAAALKDEQFDLLLTGLQSGDLGSGQTGVILGELLGMSTATLVMATELQDGSLRVKQELEGGWFRWVTVPLPACLTIQSGINQPRYPSLRGIMGAKKKELRVIPKADLIGTAVPLQGWQRVYVQQKEKRTEMIEGEVDQVVTRLVEVLKTEIKIL